MSSYAGPSAQAGAQADTQAGASGRKRARVGRVSGPYLFPTKIWLVIRLQFVRSPPIMWFFMLDIPFFQSLFCGVSSGGGWCGVGRW